MGIYGQRHVCTRVQDSLVDCLSLPAVSAHSPVMMNERSRNQYANLSDAAVIKYNTENERSDF